MTKNDRIIIGLALDVLDAAVARCGQERVDTLDVRLALRCLLPHCKEKWPLITLWDGASGDNAIGRQASCTAGLNGIRLQLKATGAL